MTLIDRVLGRQDYDSIDEFVDDIEKQDLDSVAIAVHEEHEPYHSYGTALQRPVGKGWWVVEADAGDSSYQETVGGYLLARDTDTPPEEWPYLTDSAEQDAYEALEEAEQLAQDWAERFSDDIDPDIVLS
ncbi:MAG: hypothetical protein SV186_06030 [Candidatus Nanohaloarchaea archaeon]|nr:hypothetical protein [Candidatus Nanohaloarchaea archaeon]